jgi:hypothetical protein
MLIKLASFVTLVLLSHEVIAQQSLEGIEVLGNKFIARDEVLKGFPISIGTPFGSDLMPFKTWCNELEERLHVPFARCSIVGYGGGKVYAVIDVVEENEKNKLTIQSKATLRDLALDPSIYKLSKQFTTVWIEKLRQNVDVTHTLTSNAFLDFRDPELKTISNQLLTLTPIQKQEIFNVLEYSSNESQRAEAAKLLSWCGDPNSAMDVAIRSIRDDNLSVRNNLVQFISYFFEYLKLPDIESLIASLVWQLDMPSHSDRNKALGVLYLLIQKQPELKSTIHKLAGEKITYIAKNSVLPNVGGLAQKILVELSKK